MPYKPKSFGEKARKERERERQRIYNKYRPSPAKRGYDSKWRKYRLSFLRANPLCVHCQEMDIVEPATEVDHIKPSKGDMALFWDTSNHQALCKSCHSRKTALEDSNFAKKKQREGGANL